MKLSVSIMAHRRRAHFVDELLERLGPVQVVWDTGNDLWSTRRRATEAFDAGATHHLVIQDDAVVPEGLIEAVGRVLERVPHTPVSLYTGAQGAPGGPMLERARMMARARGALGLMWPALGWGVALVVPVALIGEMLAYAGSKTVLRSLDDRRLSSYFEAERIPVFYTMRSLVDHRPAPENPSLIAGRTSSRHALDYVGAVAGPDVLEWSGPVVVPAQVASRIGPCRVCGASEYQCARVIPSAVTLGADDGH